MKNGNAKSSRAALKTIKAAVDAAEKALYARRAASEGFDDAQFAILESIPPLLASVTQPADRLVVTGLLVEMAAFIDQPTPYAVPKSNEVNPENAAAVASSRVARELIRAAVRVIMEHSVHQEIQAQHYRDLLQTAMDITHVARPNVTAKADQRELQKSFAKLNSLVAPGASKSPAFLVEGGQTDCDCCTPEDEIDEVDLMIEEAATPKIGTLH